MNNMMEAPRVVGLTRIIPGYQLGYGTFFFEAIFLEKIPEGVGLRMCMLEFQNHDPDPQHTPE